MDWLIIVPGPAQASPCVIQILSSPLRITSSAVIPPWNLCIKPHRGMRTHNPWCLLGVHFLDYPALACIVEWPQIRAWERASACDRKLRLQDEKKKKKACAFQSVLAYTCVNYTRLQWKHKNARSENNEGRKRWRRAKWGATFSLPSLDTWPAQLLHRTNRIVHFKVPQWPEKDKWKSVKLGARRLRVSKASEQNFNAPTKE